MVDCDKNNPMICFCYSVTFREIQAAIAKGARTLAQIQNETQAAMGCGGCECDIIDLLEKYRAQEALLAGAGTGRRSTDGDGTR
jgi:NAD(P)H-nitrite reductase large subunit